MTGPTPDAFPRTLTIDMTRGYEGLPVRELTVRLRVPVAGGDAAPALRVSIDRYLEEIRDRMRRGTAAKEDEDHLVLFRLLQAFGFECWPLAEDDA